MPIIHVSVTGKQDVQKKRDFMEFAANSICSHTSTLPKNIYVYFHEMEPENVRKTGENRSEIVIIFNDIPLPNAMLGGITRADNYNW